MHDAFNNGSQAPLVGEPACDSSEASGSAIPARPTLPTVTDDELMELAHSGYEEALSFGLSHDVFLRYLKTVRNRAASPSPELETRVAVEARLHRAVRALSAQSGTPADDIVDWLCSGGLAEMALSYFGGQEAASKVEQAAAWAVAAGNLLQEAGYSGSLSGMDAIRDLIARAGGDQKAAPLHPSSVQVDNVDEPK